MEESQEQENIRETRIETIKPWMFKKGQSGNPGGRPKGPSLKEWARNYLAGMTDSERLDFMHGLSKDIIWKMSEGNPDIKTDVTSGGKPIPILGYVPDNSIDKEDTGS